MEYDEDFEIKEEEEEAEDDEDFEPKMSTRLRSTRRRATSNLRSGRKRRGRPKGEARKAKSVYVCSQCGTSYMSNSSLARHRRTAHAQNSDREDDSANDEKDQLDHLNNVEGDDEPELDPINLDVMRRMGLGQCGMCLEHYNSMFELTEHIAKEHSDDSLKQSEKKFAEVLDDTKDIDDELASCDEDTLHSIKLKLQSEEAKWLEILKPMRYSTHCDKDKATCTICNKSFWSQAYLRNVHMVTVHPDKDYSKQCEHCGKVFKNHHYLNDHRSRVHKGERLNVSYPERQNRHLQYTLLRKRKANSQASKPASKSREQKHVCEYCGYETWVKDMLRYHIFEKHGISIGNTKNLVKPCPHCSFTTLHNDRLKNHLLSKHKEHCENYEDKVKACHYCNYRSPILANLRAHIFAVHESKLDENKDKLLVCHHCSYSTPTKAVLKKHIQYMHEGVKRPKKKKYVPPPDKIFACNLCDYRSNLKGNLKGHVKGVHMGIKRTRKPPNNTVSS